MKRREAQHSQPRLRGAVASLAIGTPASRRFTCGLFSVSGPRFVHRASCDALSQLLAGGSWCPPGGAPERPSSGMPAARGSRILLRRQDASGRRPSANTVIVLIILQLAAVKVFDQKNRIEQAETSPTPYADLPALTSPLASPKGRPSFP